MVINQKFNQNLVNRISKKYHLCNFCLSRLTANKTTKSTENCFICKNIFQKNDDILTRIINGISSYQFSNFEIGITLKPSLIDRDDHIKSKFKIQGAISIKSSVNDQLSKKIIKKTKSTLKHQNPDLIIKVNLKNDSYEIQSKPLYIYGRYRKKSRLLVQKQRRCVNCNGKGCNTCNFHGLQNFNSVEGLITKFLLEKFDCQQVQINWIGGEEKSSLVLGNGRPFFAKITNPKKRKKILRRMNRLEGIELLDMRKIISQPKGQIPFRSKSEIIIKTDSIIKNKLIHDLENSKMPLVIRVSRKKTLVKKIYKINFKKLSSKLFKVNIYADGGIPIKGLVKNSYVIPNFTSLLKNQCECVQFDFKKIDVMS